MMQQGKTGLARCFISLLLGLITLSAHAQDGSPALDPAEAEFDLDQFDPGPLDEDPAHRAVLDAVFTKLRNENINTQIEGRVELRRVARKQDLALLGKELRTMTNVIGQVAIIEVLGILGDRHAAKLLREEVERGHGETQWAAARALGKLRVDYGIPTLFKAVTESQDFELQKHAASALGEIGSRLAIHALGDSQGSKVRAKLSIEWARRYAEGEIDRTRIDSEFIPAQRRGALYKGMLYYVYTPTIRPKIGKPWMLVCIHDTDLEAEKLFGRCLAYAQKYHLALIVPSFDNMTFPEYDTFNLYGERSDKRLLDIIEHVATDAKLSMQEIYMFGVGRGGGFVQRFAMAYPTRVARAAFDGGDLTTLETADYFPRGIKPHPLAPELLVDPYRVAKTELLVIVRKSKDLNALRFVRGQERFLNEIERWSEANGIVPRIGSTEQRAGTLMGEYVSFPEEFLFGRDRKFDHLRDEGRRRSDRVPGQSNGFTSSLN